MTEIQGKSILVRVSARFQLARVRVVGSRLYFIYLQKSMHQGNLYFKLLVDDFISISSTTYHCIK